VRQPGPPELGGQQRVHGGRVTDDQTRQQPRRAGGQGPCRGVGQPVAEGPGGPLRAARATDRLRWRPGREHRPDVVPRLRGPDRGAHPHRLAGQQPGPLLGGPEQQHRVAAQRVPARFAEAPVDQHPGQPGPGQQPWVVVQLQQHRDHGLPVGEPGQRRDRPFVPPDRGGCTGEGDRSQARHQHRRSRTARRPAPGEHQDQPATERRCDRRGQEQPHREVGRGQGQQPDRAGGGHQPQVHPRPALLAAHAPDRQPGCWHVRPAPARPARRRSLARCR